MCFWKRIPAILTGMVFLISGLGKIGNVVDFQYLIVEYGLVNFNILAPFIILLEIAIGSLLIFNIRARFVSIGALLLVCIFTLVFTYAYITQEQTDCGCFGGFPITSTPTTVYIRNAILLLLIIYIIIFGGNDDKPKKWKIITLGTILFASTFLAGMTYKPFAFIPKEHPFANKAAIETPLKSYISTDKSSSELIMFITYSCPHCINSMENYNAWRREHVVDKTIAFVVIDTTSKTLDSLRTVFRYRYPSTPVVEIKKEEIPFVEVFPTSFLIKADSISNIITGELPSPYLFFDQ